MQRDETAKLELLTAKSIHIQRLEVENRTKLEAPRAHLDEVAIVRREELQPLAITRAEENKRNKLSALEVKL